MQHIDLNKYFHLRDIIFIWGVLGFILFFNLCNPPTTIKIGDEVSYVGWSMRILDFLYGKPEWGDRADYFTLMNYPHGNSLLLAIWWLVADSSCFFLFGTLMWCLSVLISFKTIAGQGGDARALVPYVCAVPTKFVIRTFMSENASMVISALFLLVYLSHSYTQKTKVFWLTAIAGFSMWFREANIFLFIVPVGYLINKEVSKPFAVLLGAVGLALGLLPRAVSSFVFYGTPFYVKDPGYNFSPVNIVYNLPLLSLLSLLILTGIYAVYKPQKIIINAELKILILSIGLYCLVYLAYGYNGYKESGLNSIILYNRFFMPAMPFICVILLSIKQGNENSDLKSGVRSGVCKFLAVGIAGALMVTDTYFEYAKRPLHSYFENNNIINEVYFDKGERNIRKSILPVVLKSKGELKAKTGDLSSCDQENKCFLTCIAGKKNLEKECNVANINIKMLGSCHLYYINPQ